MALMYGFSAPHFDPWKMIKVIASVCDSLENDGLFIIQEHDRIYSIFYKVGYKDLVPERIDDERALVSIHAGYDIKRGVFKRAVVDLSKKAPPIIIDAYYWNLAELMALLWIFFKDVDLIKEDGRGTAGIILGFSPRHLLSISDLKKLPRVLREKRSETDNEEYTIGMINRKLKMYLGEDLKIS